MLLDVVERLLHDTEDDRAYENWEFRQEVYEGPMASA
jgi:hypothetical protein